ncbi:54S ribosomal protein L25, mitochondrial [Exophiala dermatitidis]|uniref:54S ribosomal protein L25, mitochondrial n=1 Tax=Exophiala dermatitidis TaxID=5970 RepID=A0AAN6IU89_EXODE|nr:54S ribosomal protein L25, mitochondrial [Exophiala dermatitidis]KAJ4506393.1 54S ribosomal protein L25, mitochondrial [Exophiala dermatitidis]KAJ4506974.1 54S ribosomal protein L25, mitochondrial [Exophiala dermatitidis]KAJ4547978.1 54S ribosomal protein L25, mitochondrial [Exophiala dermatitidis]KAJ4553918.1 54S ribosomal protein L25, mitochondrial [Exophiala dermatitidis]
MEGAVQKLNLPTRLVNFFARYPPQLYSAKFTGVRLPLTRKEAKEAAIAKATQKTTITESTTSTTQGETVTRIEVEASAEVTTTPTTTTSSSLSSSSNQPTIPTVAANDLPPNPFLPRKNPITGRWAGAKIGLRRQAELVKLAQKHGIEELLPPSRKSSAFKEARLLERGLRVKGTGEGQKVKGHKWERHVGANLDKRRAAMENMPEMIREWKQRGHGRGWKKYPK